MKEGSIISNITHRILNASRKVKGTIIALVIIAIAMSMIITTMGDASAYVDFDKAFELAAKGNKSKIHVVGQLKKDQAGNILEMSYDAVKDPNYFTFTLVDNNQRAETVIFHDPKPANFEMSEQVVVIGRVIEDQFVADQILTKCPSKYQEETVEVAAGN